MGILKDLKFWLECKLTGRKNEYNSYKNRIFQCDFEIDRLDGSIKSGENLLEELKKEGYSEPSPEISRIKSNLQKWKYEAKVNKLKKSFIRPNKKNDMEYRNDYTKKQFFENLKKALSPNLNIVFHGTTIYFAEEILRTKKICSYSELAGEEMTDSNLQDKISVLDIASINRILDTFADWTSYKYCLPAGCVFAIHPKNDDYDKLNCLMSSVDFEKNPEQLYGIFTTPENIPSVQKWLKKAGLNPNLVYDFDGFVNAVKTTSSKFTDNQFRASDEVIQKIDTISKRGSRASFKRHKDKEKSIYEE